MGQQQHQMQNPSYQGYPNTQQQQQMPPSMYYGQGGSMQQRSEHER